MTVYKIVKEKLKNKIMSLVDELEADAFDYVHSSLDKDEQGFHDFIESYTNMTKTIELLEKENKNNG